MLTKEIIISKLQPFSDDGDLYRLWKPAMDIFNNSDEIYPAVETGVRGGGSSMLFMNIIALTNSKREMICIDPYTDIEYQQFYLVAKDHLKKVSDQTGVKHILNKMTSREWINSNPRHINFSLVYLDGAHNSEEVIFEIDYFLPKIIQGGYLIIDNTNWPQSNKKVLWDDCLKQRFKNVEVEGVKLIHRKE